MKRINLARAVVRGRGSALPQWTIDCFRHERHTEPQAGCWLCERPTAFPKGDDK